MLHSYVTDMAARVTPTIQIPISLQTKSLYFHKMPKMKNVEWQKIKHSPPTEKCSVVVMGQELYPFGTKILVGWFWTKHHILLGPRCYDGTLTLFQGRRGRRVKRPLLPTNRDQNYNCPVLFGIRSSPNKS